MYRYLIIIVIFVLACQSSDDQVSPQSNQMKKSSHKPQKDIKLVLTDQPIVIKEDTVAESNLDQALTGEIEEEAQEQQEVEAPLVDQLQRVHVEMDQDGKPIVGYNILDKSAASKQADQLNEPVAIDDMYDKPLAREGSLGEDKKS